MSKLTARLTLVAAAIVFLGGTAYGVKLATAPADTTPAGPTCENRAVAKGEPVTTNLVKVNVYNASERSGLANRVNINLQRMGFLGGKIGNATELGALKFGDVTIVTANPEESQVKLVAGQFKDKIRYVEPTGSLPGGVTVVVGNGYDGLEKKGTREVKADRDLSFCLPIVPVT